MKRFIILSGMRYRTVHLKQILGVRTVFMAMICTVLGACASNMAGPEASRLVAAYVVVGEEGQSVVRAIVNGPQCPALIADDVATRMTIRVPPETIALRPTQSDPALSKPSSFPLLACEVALANTVHKATVLGQPIALFKALPQRIVVVGDTGCRIKATDTVVQDCSSDQTWPFRKLADRAAAEAPDVVIHVGDYHYRESPCPPAISGCAGSPWGYGWDAWSADFFKPAAKLLATAPWVLARGNHEECSRAGQGWFRFLDPRPFASERSCNQKANDYAADFSEPYAVPLGDRWQLIVFDSATAGNNPLKPESPRDANIFAHYQANMRTVAKLAAKPGMRSIFIAHHPIFGFIPPNAYVPDGAGGNPVLLSAMRSLYGNAYFPPGVTAALHGHVHLFQAIDVASPQVSTIVAGHGGDTLDNDLPATFPDGKSPAEGVRIRAITHSNSFGYLVIDRAVDHWTVRAKRVDGTVLTTCALSEAGLACDKQGSVK